MFLLTGDSVSIPSSSFSVSEFWSNAQPNEKDSNSDEGYLELQWVLPKGMSLAEKFVLSFEQLSSETSDAVDYAVFKVSISTPKLVFDAIDQISLL